MPAQPNDLVGRTALVTGGSRGIGRGIALELAARGARVAITYRRDAEAARSVLDAISAVGGEASSFAADLGDAAEVAALAESVLTTIGGPDILVHNAGQASRGNSVADTERAEVQRLIEVHAVSPHELTRHLLPSLRAAQRGDVVFVSSAEVSAMRANGAPYNMAKSAMEALALTLANEEAHRGIHVNIVAPGLVVTEMGERLIRSLRGGIDESPDWSLAPFGRPCLPEDVARVVAAVVSPAFGYVTGQRLAVDGGAADFEAVVGVGDRRG